MSLSGAFGAVQATLAQPIRAATLGQDALPSFDELLHWSSRVSHAALVAALAIALGLGLHSLLFFSLQRATRKAQAHAQLLALTQLRHAMRWAMVAIALAFAEEADPLVAHIWSAFAPYAAPALMGWVLFCLVRILAELMARHIDVTGNELASRTSRTRITLLSRAAGFIIIFITVGMILLGLPGARHVGATLMASAGIIGLAVGAAAQPALKALIAGLQIAITEPIRIGDFVVVEGESGRVEDIRLSYVVIRTGDERRLIVPTPKFLDASFQNWTRVGGITGSVLLPIRPGFAIAPIRTAFAELLARQEAWDQRTGDLLVSEYRVGSVELKLVLSAQDPTALAALRLAMREAMLDWLRVEMPDALCTEA